MDVTFGKALDLVVIRSGDVVIFTLPQPQPRDDLRV